MELEEADLAYGNVHDDGLDPQADWPLYQKPDSVADKFRFTLIAHNFFRLFEEAYYQKAAGNLAEKDWHGITEQFLFLKDLPGFQAFWRDRKFLFSEQFNVYYDEEVILAEAHTRFEYQ